MIFVGDIAIPFKGAIKYSDFPEELYKQKWFGNLEGAIVYTDDNSINAIYNHAEAIEELISKFDFYGFGLANNHIFDIGNYLNTIDFLEQNKVAHCGIGKIKEANQEVVFYEGNQQIVIINFGWEVIQCQVAKGDYVGCNPLTKEHVLHTIGILVKKYPFAKIIPFMHWGYELESEPQPFERELAKKMIDLGVEGVIGCHSHRIGGFETYKNKPIIYSLGNWMFKQNHYFREKHKFPDFCSLQLAFEWDFGGDSFQFHFFNYDKELSKLSYIKSEDVESKIMLSRTSFKQMAEIEYKKWYNKNHYHKNKGLPIYYWEDSDITVFLKNKMNKIRDSFIGLIAKLR